MKLWSIAAAALATILAQPVAADMVLSTSNAPDPVAEAIRAYFTDTHNVAEGAGAAALAAVLKDRDRCQGKQVAVVLCGQNVDAQKFREVLAEA